MTEVASPLRVLVVGAGRRVQNNFFPVLRTLDDLFTVTGVHSRTLATLQPVADAWGIPAIAKLTGEVLQNTDVVAISVPTAQNAVVLQALLPYAAKLSIVIDTPIAWNRRELAATAPLLAQFKRVVVTEDYMNFPAFALVRRAVAQGLIGKPTALTLNNIGYLYHGMALIRSFVGFQPAIRTWRHKTGSMTSIVGYHFKGGFEACVVGPYRRTSPNGLALEGTEGVITQYADDMPRATASRPVYLMSPCYSGGDLTGYRIEAGSKSLDIFPAELAAMRNMPFADKSDINLQRGCGLASVFRSLHNMPNDPATALNNAYGPDNAIYDGFICRLAERGILPFDPLTWIGRDAMILMHAASRLRR